MQKVFVILAAFVFVGELNAQAFEWRLAKLVYSATDPDAGGAATGQVSFTLQIHTTGPTVDYITQISTGYAYQSAKAMLPTTAACTSTNTPANITVSPAFVAAGFAYTVVNQCNAVNPTINAGGQVFDRRANGTIDNGSISIGSAWVDVFTVTLWTLGNVSPQGGYVMINSSEGGSPGEYTTYSVSSLNPSNFTVTQYPANSLTYASPLALASAPLPVHLTKFEAQCQPNKTTSISWATLQETNNAYFEVQRSADGLNWTTINRTMAAGSSSAPRNYQVADLQGGAAQYRLVQVDKDGKSTYSAVVKTTCEGRNIYVTLYPVPAKDVITLSVGSDRSVKTNLQVFDSKGRMVINMPATITAGQNNFQIRLNQLTAGEYILKGTAEGIDISKRFSIIR